MKLRMIILGLTIVLGITMAACQAGGTNREESATTANANTASKAETKAAKPSIDEIREVLQAHDKALSDKNLDGVMATFSTDPTTVVLGTGAEERWMGQQEIRAAYTEIFKGYDAGTLTTNCQAWKTGGSDDAAQMAWLAAICDCKESLAGKAREYKLAVSATIEKQDGKWRFVVLHMSNAIAPPVTK